MVSIILRDHLEREEVSSCLGSQCPNKELKKGYHRIPGLPIPHDICSANDAKLAIENWFSAGVESICGSSVVNNLTDKDITWKEVDDLCTNEK